MMIRVQHYWERVRSSLWFVPGLIVIASIVLALACLRIDTLLIDRRPPWDILRGGGADGAREILSSISSSMITIAGVTFSITIVSLSLASTQYSPRVLRNFMRDPANQCVLGVFVGIFTYCLVVLRTVSSDNGQAFIPSVSVLVAVGLALIGVAFLIFFIHHIAASIQASNIIEAISTETASAINKLFPEEVGAEASAEGAHDFERHLKNAAWCNVPARHTGYIEGLDENSIMKVARKRDVVLRMERGIGEFVVKGMPLMAVAGAGEKEDHQLDDDLPRQISSTISMNNQRTLSQDATFGIRQLVDIAIKALSPGINDTTTATICIDHLTALLVRVTQRHIESPYRLDDTGALRLIARGPTFVSMLDLSYRQILENGEGNSAILQRLLDSLDTVGFAARTAKQRAEVRSHLEQVIETIRRTVRAPHALQRLQENARRIVSALDAKDRSPHTLPSGKHQPEPAELT